MAALTFAAIDIGSYNVSMEIFEIGRRSTLRSLNRVRTRLELGADTFNLKRISGERLRELIVILNDYRHMMAEYQVTAYRACAKSALREAANSALVLEAVYQATSIRIDILANAEQRFLGCQSIAAAGSAFHDYIAEGTAIIDLGGGSVQISLFDQKKLVSTANMPLGSLRIREKLAGLERMARHYPELVEEVINREIENFKRLYLGERRIKNVILVGDYFTNLIFQNRADTSKIETRAEFMHWYDHIIRQSSAELEREMGIDSEMASVVIPSAILYRRLIEELGADTIWLPGIQLTDGIAYDYAHRHKLLRETHNFDQDILASAAHIADRFGCSRPHIANVTMIAESIFDGVRKGSGLGPREKLLLRTAAMLYECGRFISLNDAGESACNIIMATEIIGLSRREREIIAGAALYQEQPFDYSGKSRLSGLDTGSLMCAVKLTAILRLASALDESRRQKAESVSCSRRGDVFTVQIVTEKDFILEAGSFESRGSLFEEVFGMKLQLKITKKKGR